MKQNILYLLLPALLFAACSNDDDGFPRGWESGPGEQIRFEIGFAPTGGGSWTRAATGADFKTKWEDGDEVGVFAVKGNGGLQSSGNWEDNLKLTRQNDGTWQPESAVYYPNNGETLDFYAYYPYDAGMSDPTSHTFSVKSDQSAEEDYNRSDLLLAQAANAAKGSAVSLQFSHALSLVQVEVKREVNVPHFNDDLTVTLTDVLTDATLNWTGATAGSGTPSDIVMHKVADMDYIYRALVPAQTLSGESKVTFVQTGPDREINMEYQGVQNAPLTAGAANKYSVTLGWGINPDHTYAVGDKYPHTGPAIGIVYEIENNGRHGKVVSLDEGTSVQWADNSNWTVQTNATDQSNGRVNMYTMSDFIASQSKNWSNFPAFDWVHTTKNGGTADYSQADATGIWYLPALDELRALYSAYNSYDKNNFNNRLTDAGGTSLSDSWYWSSSERVSIGAYVVDFSDGDVSSGLKDLNLRVRPVLAF